MMDIGTIIGAGASLVAIAGVGGLAYAAHPFRGTPDEFAPPLIPVDWSKPLELISDGTPLVFRDPDEPADGDGDYYLVREDGLPFTRAQKHGGLPEVLIVEPTGKEWWNDNKRDPILVRNRAPVAANDETPFLTNSDWPALTWDQLLVLGEMSSDIAYQAAWLAARTGLSAKRVGEVRKELRELGLAEFGALWHDDDGKLMGRGYWLTDKGVDLQQQMLADVEGLAA